MKLSGGKSSFNRDLEAKARALADYKGYITNLDPLPAEPQDLATKINHEAALAH